MKDLRGFDESFEKIEIQKPTELIIQQIKRQISTGKLKPGDKLPPERDLAAKLNVGRGYVREAIKKLEFYGILKIVPHKGTVVTGLGEKALEGLISNVLEMEKDNFRSVVETRLILETNAAYFAAERATDSEIEKIIKAHDHYRNLALKEEPDIEVDLLFHLRIAEFCKNSVLRSMISLITPDVIFYSRKITGNVSAYKQLSHIVVPEHEAIIEALKKHDAKAASEAMKNHLTRILLLVTALEKEKEKFNFQEWFEQYKKKFKGD